MASFSIGVDPGNQHDDLTAVAGTGGSSKGLIIVVDKAVYTTKRSIKVAIQMAMEKLDRLNVNPA